MAKKDFFLIVDTETTQDDKVADFGAIITDRKGNILNQCAVLIHGVFGNSPLFFDSSLPPDALWSQAGEDRRMKTYYKMLEGGTRSIASVGAVNRWIDKAISVYNPTLTAYNLAFDLGKCSNTGIDLIQFEKSFCLWAGAVSRWGHSKKYRQFVLENHAFNNVTKHGNMTFKANAEIMARFVLNNPELEDEPHTALEDIIFYELPILKALMKNRKISDFKGLTKPDWRKMQVKDWFKAI